MIVTCKVIEDLLPLYADGICSEDTKTVVEHHTAECADCRKKLEAMTSDTVETEKSGKEKPSPENPFKKLRRHYTRLVVCTLLICAAVMIPSALVFRLYVNEETNNKGMSFSSLSAGRDMKRFGNMLKRGEYRAALDTVELYYQYDYNAQELAVIKDMLAADLEEYYKKYPIKKVKAEPSGGKCSNGNLYLYLDEESLRGTDMEPMQNIYFDFGENDDGSRLMMLGGCELWGLDYGSDSSLYRDMSVTFPMLTLIPKSQPENIFSNLKKERSYMFWYFMTDEKISYAAQTDEMWGISKEEVINCVYSEKAVELLSDYSFIGCENGDITYVHEDILDMHSYFLQHAFLTMSTADGSEFTVEFDMPIVYFNDFTHLKNVSYSDNAPNDFRSRFEDIFVNDEPVYGQYYEQYQDHKLNDGKFYLNGNTESCYYEVKDGRIQLIIENDKQAREFFETEMANTTNELFYNANYDEWLSSVSNHCAEPTDYEVIPTVRGLFIALMISYSSDGERQGYSGLDYTDSDHIIYSDCTFTRV